MKITLNLTLGIELPDVLYHKLNVCEEQNKEESALTTSATSSRPPLSATILRVVAILGSVLTPLGYLLPYIT
ncbi:hypothetical protein SOM16_16660 [Pedobacter sp. CFBP9032]|nr:hypothetical protein [Pedobacter sp. CFBP9032]